MNLTYRNCLGKYVAMAAAIGIITCGHYVSAETIQLGADKLQQLQQIRMKQIPLLEQFLHKYPGSDRTAETLHRLGEAYFETAKFYQSQNNNAQAKRHWQRASEVLERVRTQYSNYQHLDQALFTLGNTYMATQDQARASAVLGDIAERFPNSEALKDSSLLLGDYYFSKNDLARAGRYYRAALGQASMASYIHYKLAWVAQNLGNPNEAISHFKQVLALRSQEGLAGDYSNDAAREIVVPALQMYPSHQIISFLEATLKDSDLIRDSLITLSRLAMKRMSYEMASIALDRLQILYPAAPEKGQWATDQLKAEQALGRSDRIQTLLARMDAMPSSETKEMQSQFLMTARKFHSEGQKTTNASDKNSAYEKAIANYQGYLKLAGTGPLMAQTSFYLGEALYERGRFEEAVNAYEQALSVKTDIYSKALWNKYLTLEKLAEAFKYSGKERQELGAFDQRYLDAIAQIQADVKISSIQKRKAAYQGARILYQLNQFETALPRFEQIAKSAPQTEEGKLSAQLVLDIYNLKKDYQNIARYAREYQHTADAGAVAELKVLEQGAILNGIAEEEKQVRASGDGKESQRNIARKYLEFAQSNPRASKADGALWAAVQNFGDAALADKGIFPEFKSAFMSLVRQYPNSSYASRAVVMMGDYLTRRSIPESELSDFRPFRSTWASEYARSSRNEAGRWGMLVYRLSNNTQKHAMEKDFRTLPNSVANREAYAHGRVPEIKALAKELRAIAMNNLKTLTKNTQKKIAQLDLIQTKVTSVVELKIADPAIEALRVLGDSYAHVAKSLRLAPVPKGLAEDQKIQYRRAVEEKAALLDSKARDAQELAEKTERELSASAS